MRVFVSGGPDQPLEEWENAWQVIGADGKLRDPTPEEVLRIGGPPREGPDDVRERAQAMMDESLRKEGLLPADPTEGNEPAADPGGEDATSGVDPAR